MKLLIFAVVIFLVAADDKYKLRDDIAEQWEELVETHKEECLKESGQKEEDVRHFHKKGYYPNTPEFKHYIKCLAIKLNLVSEDGIFNEESIHCTIKAADLDIYEGSLVAVNDEKDVDEKIYSFALLFVEQIAKRYPPQH